MLEYMALNKRGVNCLRMIFANFEGIMKVNEESQRNKLRKEKHKIVLVDFQKIKPVVSAIQPVVFNNS